MPKIYPFKAVRYHLSNAALKGAVCPPYDVIGEDQAKRLRSDARNAIHIELPEGEGDAKYGNARKIWDAWRSGGTVRQDAAPAFYVYEQKFTVNGKKLQRRGFFCELEVEEPGKGSVLRHELTIAGPKVDRFNLLRALHINTSPIFGLYKDAAKKSVAVLRAAVKKKPAADITDADSVSHKLWAVTDARAIRVLQELIAKNPVVIADGHHRYETAWNYKKEMEHSRLEGAGRTLFFLCPMDDPGLVVFPTHRILVQPGHAALGLEDIKKRIFELSAIFTVKEGELRSKPGAGFSFAVTDGKRAVNVFVRSKQALAKAFPGKAKAYQDLPLLHLHALVLPEMKKEDFIYVHEDQEAVKLAREKQKLAFLVPATPIKDMFAVVRAGEVMPQKSTYFYPKVITGILFRSLE